MKANASPGVGRFGALAGAGVFCAAAAIAIAVATLTAWSLHWELSVGEALRLAALYLASFHRGGIEVEWAPLPDSLLDAVVSGALMGGTALVVWAAWTSGRAAGDRFPDRRTIAGASVALGYVIPVACAAVLSGSLPLPTESASFAVVPLSSIAWAVALGFGASLGGALWPGVQEGVLRSGARGAARMVSWCLLGSFVAMLVVAGLDPSYSRAYFAGVRAARSDGGAAAVAHNLLLLPNETAWISTAAMGGCISVQGTIDADLVCNGRLADGLGTDDLLNAPTDPETAVPVRSRSLPLVLLVFALVPPVAVLGGGALAARGAGGYADASRRGLLTGALFAVAFSAVAAFAGFGVAAGPDDQALGDLSLRVGPAFPITAGVALAWGLLGGVLGAVAATAVRRRASSNR